MCVAMSCVRPVTCGPDELQAFARMVAARPASGAHTGAAPPDHDGTGLRLAHSIVQVPPEREGTCDDV